ncbi:uncharacterized protein LOC127243083 [Andrographis paniculata]|uniref:uncharacterized protein LOC127243083 n=1 Tax=Andrographis paniculata TaxID=175694 RepID=UPI0021E98B1A|nr:uncharacterized protein LOC127243083 [Andrographis paniculata]
MDQSRGPRLEGIGIAAKRKRSQTSRRPKPEPEPEPHPQSDSPKSSTPVSDDTSKMSSDENICDGKSGGKMFNLNQCVSRSLPVNGSDGGSSMIPQDGDGVENKVKKVKLKVGGVTRTIQPKATSNGMAGRNISVKTNQLSDDARLQQRLTSQESSDEYHSPPTDKKSGLQGIPWKDFSKGSFSIGAEDMGRPSTRIASDNQGGKSEAVRKSKRAPKRRVLDDDFNEDDEDDEIRYLEKLKNSKMSGNKGSEALSARKPQRGVKHDNMEDGGRLGKDARKSRSGDFAYEEDEEEEEEEPLSDGESEGKRKKKQKKDLSELPTDTKKEIALTTRQRALLNKDSSSPSGANQIEYPNGLPPAPSRKQKDKGSEVDQQLKKAEAAQRRRLQNEKAAREIEAEAIRKILGQDSSRKKREEKMKKRQEELAQEKAVSAQMLASNTIRTIIGPSGTTVTFPNEMGLPKLFDPKPISYPPPREKCAGPSCTNPYKYRDSKSKLPLCSLQCYKAIHEKMQKEEASC